MKVQHKAAIALLAFMPVFLGSLFDKLPILQVHGEQGMAQAAASESYPANIDFPAKDNGSPDDYGIYNLAAWILI